jgi:hypothetical protein
MIVEALLRHLYGGAGSGRVPDEEPYELPENLARFYAARTTPPEPRASACCTPAEQASCCAPVDKDECCGASAARECGCR